MLFNGEYFRYVIFALALLAVAMSLGAFIVMMVSSSEARKRRAAARLDARFSVMAATATFWIVPYQNTVLQLSGAVRRYRLEQTTDTEASMAQSSAAYRSAQDEAKRALEDEENDGLNGIDRDRCRSHEETIDHLLRSITQPPPPDDVETPAVREAARLYELEIELDNLWEVLARGTGSVLAFAYSPTPHDLLAEAIRGLTGFLRQVQSLRDQTTALPEVQAALDVRRLGLALGALALGVAYVAVFVPLAWVSVSDTGLSPVQILLFAAASPSLEQAFSQHMFPWVVGGSAQPTVWAIGSAVGTLMIASAIGTLADSRRVTLNVQSQMLAYAVTATIGHSLGFLPAFIAPLFLLKTVYVVASFTIFSSLPDVLGKEGVRRGKYDRFFNQSHGLIAASLLSMNFGAQSVIFSSAIFYVSLFLTTSMVEVVINRDPRQLGQVLQPIPIATVRERLKRSPEAKGTALVLVVITPIFHLVLVTLYWTVLATP